LFDVCMPEVLGIFFQEEGLEPREAYFEYMQPLMDEIVYYRRFDGSRDQLVAHLNNLIPNYQFSLDKKKILVNGNFKEVIEETVIEESRIEEGKYYAKTNFKLDEDGYGFNNIGSEVGTGGVCAGFAYSTMKLYHGDYSKTGSAVLDNGETIEYDLSDSRFAGMFNGQLFLQKVDDPVFSAYYKELTPPKLPTTQMKTIDQNIIRSIEVSWDNANDVSKESNIDNMIWSTYEFGVIDKLKDELSNDRIIYTTLSKPGISGHAVVTYGMEQDPVNPNVIYLDIYDNNFSNNTTNIRKEGTLIGTKPITKRFEIYRFPKKVLTIKGFKYYDEFDFRYGLLTADGKWSPTYSYMSLDESFVRANGAFETIGAIYYQKLLRKMNNGEFKREVSDQIMFYNGDMEPLIAERQEMKDTMVGLEMELSNDVLNNDETVGISVYKILEDGSKEEVTYESKCGIGLAMTDIFIGHIKSKNQLYKDSFFSKDQLTIIATYGGFKATKTIEVQ